MFLLLLYLRFGLGGLLLLGALRYEGAMSSPIADVFLCGCFAACHRWSVEGHSEHMIFSFFWALIGSVLLIGITPEQVVTGTYSSCCMLYGVIIM